MGTNTKKAKHECKESTTCTCHLLAPEPNENCPIHGHGTFPPKCEECGRIMRHPYDECSYISFLFT